MKFLAFTILFTIIPFNTFSKELRVACASNFIVPMKEISKTFEKNENIKVLNTFGATGMLFGQIKKGAPYDIFFAADMERPKILIKEKRADSFFIYAKGETVLWTKSKELLNLKDYKEVLKKSVKISIANPKTAPYGKSAVNFLKKENLYNKFLEKFVYGKSVATSFQYAYSGFADSGFLALSQAISKKGKEGRYFLLKGSKDIVQGGCILNNSNTSKKFLDSVLSSDKIIKKYGYSN